MAFANRNLSVLAYANGFTLWHYKGIDDTLAEANADNYFSEASDMLTKGDVIMVSASNGARMRMVVAAELTTVITGPMA
jgi:glucuronate isomerase